MSNPESQKEVISQNIQEACAIATQYIYLPEQQRSVLHVFRSSDTAYEARVLEHSLSESLAREFQSRGVTELEGYYLAFFAVQKVKSIRSLQHITFERPSGGEVYNQRIFNEHDAFRKKMIRADKAFELYGKLADASKGLSSQAVHDWFVRMRIAGVDVGDNISLPPSIVTVNTIDKAVRDVKSKRAPELQLDRTGMRQMLDDAGMRDPLLDVL
jgi:hypothetical protein